ncbi:MAG: hypothetical protein HY719_16960 [Planctomycetes bacterium]|nr:hypothetical protein [Planctomycetota bacterium]
MQFTRSRSRVLARFLVACFLVAGTSPAVVAQQVPGKDPTKSFPDLVRTAVEKGVAWLKKKQQPEGNFGRSTGLNYAGGSNTYPIIIGNTAFPLYTMLKCGVPKDDPVMVKGFEFLRKKCQEDVRTTYELAACLMAFEEFSTKKPDRKRDEREFEYKKRCATESRVSLAAADKPLVMEILADLIGILNDGPGVPAAGVVGKGWRYGNSGYTRAKSDRLARAGAPKPMVGVGNTAGDMDISATQFGLLGLKSATRMGLRDDIKRIYATRPGVKAGASIYYDVLLYLLCQQEQEGPVVAAKNEEKDPRRTFVPAPADQARGWSYMPWHTEEESHCRQTGSMTTAGVCAVILCKSELTNHSAFTSKLRKETDRAIRDGIAWLSLHYVVDRNPTVHLGAETNRGAGSNRYYYLYGLERMGVFGDFDKIDTHDWYVDGATALLGDQKKATEGEWYWGWGGGRTPEDEHDTCFALLFLEKASIPMPGVVEITRGPG